MPLSDSGVSKIKKKSADSIQRKEESEVSIAPPEEDSEESRRR